MCVKIIVLLLAGLLLAGTVIAQTRTFEDEPGGRPELLLKPLESEASNYKALKQEADRSLERARAAIKKSGFYCANIELNIWKNLSQRVDTFDEELFIALQNELYSSSMMHMEKWFAYYLKKGYYNDAQKCLQTWRLHAQVINKFDEELYGTWASALEALKEK